jgi:hypothetical protein
MKRNRFAARAMAIVWVAVAVLAVFNTPLWAEEDKVTGDITTAVLSQYVWRGYELSRNSFVVQPSVTLSYKGFSANFWGNLDRKPYSPGSDSYSGTWNETDLTLSYSTTIGLFNVGGGYIYYALDPANRDAANPDDSQELYATLSLNTLLSPTVTLYKEIDHYRNLYILFGVSHAIEMSPKLTLKLAASAGYLLSTDADKYAKYDGNALPTTDKFSNFHDGTLAASLPVKVSDSWTLTPTLSFIFPLSGDAKNEMKGKGLQGTASPAERNSSFLVGGILASYTF